MSQIFFLPSSYVGTRLHKLPWIVIVLCFVIYIGGCAPKTLYYWGNYEDCLYEINMNSNPEAAFNILSEAVTHVEKIQGIRLAPGLYAEYGFMLYQQGKIDEAAHYFRMESESFPESSPLMGKLITRIEESRARSNDEQPAEESNHEMTSESEEEILGEEG